MTSKISAQNVSTPCNSKTGAKARSQLRRMFPIPLPSAVADVTIKVEHALVDLCIIKCGLTAFMTVEELDCNWMWFYSLKTQSYKLRHLEVSTFYDSTPIGKDGDACSGL